MSLSDDNDPVRALGFVAVYSAFAEQHIDELVAYFSLHDASQKPRLKNAQAAEKLKYLRKVSVDLEWQHDEGDRFAEVVNVALESMDKRGEYLHNRYIGLTDGKILMKPGRANRKEEEITSSQLYEFANDLFNLQSALYASGFWVRRAGKSNLTNQSSSQPLAARTPQSGAPN